MISEYDAKRLRSELEQFIQKLENDSTEVRLDSCLLMAVCTWDDEDGDEHEAIMQYCSSKRPHVRFGILHSAVAQHLSLFTNAGG